MLSVTYRRVFRIILLAMAVTILQSCGSGGGSSSASNNGRIRLLVTDAPTSNFDQINITVSSIELLGEGPGVYLTSQPMTFNLLDLRNVSTSLGVNDSVPVGTYTKLRMDVSKIDLVKLNSDGTVASTVSPELPSGHIDLNPQSQITVAPGSDLVVQMDINADNSFQVTTTGTGNYIFRPQVLINVLNDASNALVRLSGTALGVTANTFELCKEGASQVDSSCEKVNISGSTVVKNTAMGTINYADIQSGDSAVVFGLLSKNALELNAIDIFDGTSVLSSFKGDFTGPVAADGSAGFSITQSSTGVAVNDTLPITPFSNAGLLNKQGAAVDSSTIAAGLTAQVIGVLKPNSTTPQSIKPGLIIVN